MEVLSGQSVILDSKHLHATLKYLYFFNWSSNNYTYAPQGLGLVVRTHHEMCGLGTCHGFEPRCRQKPDIVVDKGKGAGPLSTEFQTVRH